MKELMEVMALWNQTLANSWKQFSKITVALTHGHHNHKMNVKMILYYWDKMEFYLDPRKPVPYKRVHRSFFEFTIALFTVLSLLFHMSENWDSLAGY